MTVSLILPCYNPPAGWEHVVCSNYSLFSKEITDSIELIVVMDGTSSTVTDAAIATLRENISGIKLIQYSDNRGKGYAIRQGVAQATGEIIVYTDIDFPYTHSSLIAVYNSLKSNDTDVAVGIKDETYYAHVPLLRRVISRYLRFLIRVFLSMPVTDTQCGLKGFKKEVTSLFLQTTIDRYLFDLEFIRNCFKSKKYRVKAIPVTLNENVHFRSMNYRILLPEILNFAKLLFNK